MCQFTWKSWVLSTAKASPAQALLMPGLLWLQTFARPRTSTSMVMCKRKKHLRKSPSKAFVVPHPAQCLEG